MNEMSNSKDRYYVIEQANGYNIVLSEWDNVMDAENFAADYAKDQMDEYPNSLEVVRVVSVVTVDFQVTKETM